MGSRYDPFAVFGDAEDVRDPHLDGYSARQTEGDEFRVDGTAAQSLRLTIDVRRIRLFTVLIAGGFIVLLGRVWFLQLPMGSTYAAAAEGNHIRIQYVTADRGVITDRNGTQLVRNTPVFAVQVTPGSLPDDSPTRETLIERMSDILQLPRNEVREQLNGRSQYRYQPMTLATVYDHETALRLKIELESYSGVDITPIASREYLYPEPLSHVLGYVGKIPEPDIDTYLDQGYLLSDTVGLSGIESTYEATLKGKDGRQHVEVDSLGRIRKIIDSEESVSGNIVELSIDLRLQETLYNSLKDMVEAKETTGGAAIALDPQTGDVIALASYPGYDPNVFIDDRSSDALTALFSDERNPLFNRVLSGEYPSGSTIKPVIAAAALEENLITRETSFLSTGGIRINQWFFPDWRPGGHGQTNVISAIANSVNTFFYIIGGGFEGFTGLGVDRIKAYAEKFGFYQPTGIDLPGERKGFLPTKEWKEEVKGERWYIGDTYHLAIGQGDLLVTPIQMANAMSAIANGGTLYRPRLVRRIINPDDPSVVNDEPVAVLNERVAREDTLAIVREGLRAAVTDGSARRLGSLPVSAAGKTGTAQFGIGGQTHAWFAGFAPYDNPEVVIVTMIEGGGDGHAAALPVAQSFLQEYFSGVTKEHS